MILYICIKFHENILNCFKVTEQTQFPYGKLQRALFCTKEKVALWFMFSAHYLILHYSYTIFFSTNGLMML